jgi:predicted transcriptional regulator
LQEQYIKGVESFLKTDIRMEFVFGKGALEFFAKTAKESIAEFDRKSEFYELDLEHMPAFIYSPTFVCLSLESKTASENYMDMKLFSKSEEAIGWGEELFGYYKAKAKRVKLSDYL